ncbi:MULTISPECIES: hypothetical protein [unclassified Leeuwenhoekiella]|uniref:hypothetical protein n=1 Tax=unclassified Leeuwenhoekiella TaxID=2615029 RepID=UPI000C3EF5C3|nr:MULTISPECIES: hypothetical protein [unclassified Leeuwenhoekiella]MAW96699.1 hypothetical protein [Leeuwenhoekiella sp.]MBA81588.1 hypothetical protein [Leeuwenhoekiella sp.]|tara:strand:+ start:63119 stop:63673 length:555 start_codon:yes stop_codon:yes gene_type:complete
MNSSAFSNKIIPEVLKNEAQTALSYYPQLQETSIRFQFKKNIKKSTMQAQPVFKSLFKSRKNREYVIFISKKVKIEDESFKITDIPSDVLIGWLGHELGHVMDYRNRSSLGLIWFGIKYLYVPNFIREAERAADTFAVAHGMGEYILKTKDFILNHAHISEPYKARIKRLYLSPEEIMRLINED